MAFDFLDRSRSIAPANYDRWRVPPAALAIHLAIGQADCSRRGVSLASLGLFW
ncbi:MAG: hypothetical protein NTU67_08285 [Gemmatimonadetes bacterium]|nr:hypothetical protein [Gemmatimonadota bacterium]